MTGDIDKLRQLLRNATATLQAHDMEAGLWINEVRAQIAAALVLSFRSSSGRPRAPRKARRMTVEIAARVRWIKDNNPDMSLQEIANELRLGAGGRVSEVLTGQWQAAQANYDAIKPYT